MQKFRKKPVVIIEIIAECERSGGININTLEGIMLVSKGDWVIKGVKGEYYPCKPDIFEATYEQI